MAVVVRPDLSQRTALSKSAVVGWDLCPTKAGFELTERRPLVVNEKISFGAALDAACEALVIGRRDGWSEMRAMSAAVEGIEQITERDGIELPLVELTIAYRGFWNEVTPRFDWTGAETQPEIEADIPGLGEVQGHPDIVLGRSVLDVKSSKYKKDLPSVELGLYAILLEEARGIEVDAAYYLTWVRSGRGRWEVQRWDIGGEARRWTWARVNQYARAKELGAFYGAPKFPGLCTDCAYNPANGGPCEIAYQGGGDE